MDNGELCVMTRGVTVMHRWCVDNLDIKICSITTPALPLELVLDLSG